MSSLARVVMQMSLPLAAAAFAHLPSTRHPPPDVASLRGAARPRLVLDFQEAMPGSRPRKASNQPKLQSMGISFLSGSQMPSEGNNDGFRVKGRRLDRIRTAWVAYLAVSSDKLWHSVFDECDGDSDGNINRRELLVLLHRLGIEMPTAEKLKALFVQYDVDVRATDKCLGRVHAMQK